MVAEPRGGVKAEEAADRSPGAGRKSRGSGRPEAAQKASDGGGASARARRLVERLAGVRGLALTPSASMAAMTTFKLGGPAELAAVADGEAALAALLRAVRDEACPLTVIGLGSNVLVPDRGLEGVVLRLGKGFKRIRVDRRRVVAGAAVPMPTLARQTARRGLTGLEPLCGFPSTVGGAVTMNAGCYGVEVKDVLISAWLLEPDGSRRRIEVGELGAGYRHTVLQGSGAIVTRASFRLAPGDADVCTARIEELNERRWASLPYGVGNAGSTFKNPPGDYAGRLIEAVGLKGERRGGAQISPKHANVFINLDDASADDVLGLMLEARRRVHERFGITLKPEVILPAELGERWRAQAPPTTPDVPDR